MNEIKFTPGPWFSVAKLSGSENHRGFKICTPTGWALADVQPADEDGIEGRANAHLIAAAPDLYEALEHILEGSLSLPRFAKDEAIRALAKARGEG